MSDMLFQLVLLALMIPHLILFVVFGYYMLKLRAKEKNLEVKEGKIDANYHQVVDSALSKERKILEDAIAEAGEIIAGAQYINKESRGVIAEALQKMTVDIQKEAADTAHNFTSNYQVSLRQLSLQSLAGFQEVVKSLREDLKKEIVMFHETLLPKMEKELEEYKKARLEQADKMVVRIIQSVSQELLSKTISIEDHQKLVTDALERAKKEGAFE